MNSSSAMPISVTLASCSGSRIRPSSCGPDQCAGDDVAKVAPSFRRRNRVTKTSAAPSMIAPLSRMAVVACAVSAGWSPRRLNSREKRAERQEDRPVPRLRGRAGASATMPGQLRLCVLLLRQPAADAERGIGDFVMRSPTACCWTSAARPGRMRRRGRAARSFGRGRSSSSSTAIVIRLPQVGERNSARPSSRSSSAPPEARQRAAGFGRVERRGHSRRQVVPPGPSSKTMPSALNSSRMRSAVAKSRASLGGASARSRDRTSIRSSPSRCALKPVACRALCSRPSRLRWPHERPHPTDLQLPTIARAQRRVQIVVKRLEHPSSGLLGSASPDRSDRAGQAVALALLDRAYPSTAAASDNAPTTAPAAASRPCGPAPAAPPA